MAAESLEEQAPEAQALFADGKTQALIRGSPSQGGNSNRRKRSVGK